MARKNGNGNGKKDGRNGKAKTGRPLKLTKALISEMAAHIRKGLTYKDAAFLCLVCDRSVIRWRDQGEADLEAGNDTLYSQFFLAIKRARLELKAELIGLVKSAPLEDIKHWTAAARLLEAFWPEDFERRVRAEMAHSGEVKLSIEWSESNGKPHNGD